MNPKVNPYIFIVEDDLMYQAMIKNELELNGYNKIEVFDSGKACLSNLHKMPEIVLLDYNLSGEMNGLQVLKSIKSFDPDIQVVMLSSQEKIEVAVDSLKYGTYDYVIKSDTAMKRISVLIDRICRWNQMLEENKKYKSRNYLSTVVGAIIATAVITMTLLFA